MNSNRDIDSELQPLASRTLPPHGRGHPQRRRWVRRLVWAAVWAASIWLTWFFATEGQKEWRPVFYDQASPQPGYCAEAGLSFWVDDISPALPDDGGLMFKVWVESEHIADVRTQYSEGLMSKRTFTQPYGELGVGKHLFAYRTEENGGISWTSDFASRGYVVQEATVAVFHVGHGSGTIMITFEYLTPRINADVLRDISCFWDAVADHWEISK